MKTMISLALTSVAVVSLIFAMSPAAMAYSEDGSRTYKNHWAISIGESTGMLEIVEDTDIAALQEQAISAEDAAQGYENVVKTRLGKAVNDLGSYFLVWKVMTSESNEESGTTYTVNVLDAGNGDLLISMTKDGGGCSHKDKSGTTSTSGHA